jgi:hypothetical protein
LDALDILTALLSPEREGAAPGPAEREAALAHVANCSDCWTGLVSLHEVVTGAPPSESARMAALFGCDRFQPLYHRLSGLAPARMLAEHPAAARHLAWCAACRTRVAELTAVARDADAPGLADAVAGAGGAVREAVGRLVVLVGRAVAGFAALPEGFLVLEPVPAPVPVRGGTATADTASLVGRSARFSLGDGAAAAEVAVEPEDDAHVALSVRLAGDAPERLSLRLRELRADGEVLVARYTLAAPNPVVVRGLWAGSFLLELARPGGDDRYRVRLDIGPCG